MGTLCKRSRVTSAEGVKGQEDYTRTLHPTNPPGKAPSFLGPNEHVCLVILKSNVRILCNYLFSMGNNMHRVHTQVFRSHFCHPGRTSGMCAQLWHASLPKAPCQWYLVQILIAFQSAPTCRHFSMFYYFRVNILNPVPIQTEVQVEPGL